MKKILLTGASGFFGYHISKVLKDYNLFPVSSKNYDLLDANQVKSMFKDIEPNIVIHLAAKVGGIMANKTYPAEFWYKNMMMTAQMWELSKEYSVDKLIFIVPGCSYPKDVQAPMKEETIWDGYPDEFSAPGALAKKMGIVASYAYRNQFRLNSCTLIPANLYGEFDHFEENNSHVVSALITKIHKAKTNNLKEVTLWGTGMAKRDFVYVEDAAKCIPYFIENNPQYGDCPYLNNVFNISSGKGCSIKELAETIMEVIGFEGKLIWDTSKPDGALNKVFNNERMKSFGLECPTSLKEGITKTYEWFKLTYGV